MTSGLALLTVKSTGRGGQAGSNHNGRFLFNTKSLNLLS